MKIAYVVLGMHRSGTSSVAGALVQLGATAPLTLMTPKPENPKGFWESEAIMAFNDRLLAACGSSWNDWRALDDGPISGEAGLVLLAQGLAVLDAEFKGQDRIVLKDPRICRLFPFWARVLAEAGYRPVVITPLRDPTEVAASLAARNDMSVEFGWRLWLQHVLAAERHSRGYSRHFMAWDAFLSDWKAQVDLMGDRLRDRLEITADIEVLMSDFLAPELRHHRSSGDRRVPDLVADVNLALIALAAGGEDGQITQRLDASKATFDDAIRLFDDAF